ncbi:hypothetical protein Pmani_036681 [Petrolisthes manimaculis]|uniref:Uncharacterized protein n=1 Tax=Petrolisthes manimaculis TaxID=1843537 RepID=A0AAE1NIX2_9EUCA|nr:hypothetical protein Pmani_036681 [Petrolisthes manimaculis]
MNAKEEALHFTLSFCLAFRMFSIVVIPETIVKNNVQITTDGATYINTNWRRGFVMTCDVTLTRGRGEGRHPKGGAQSALIYDAVRVVAEALTRLMRKKAEQFGDGPGLGSARMISCNTDVSDKSIWEHGEKITRHMRKDVRVIDSTAGTVVRDEWPQSTSSDNSENNNIS